jgi:hypothetical protein
MKNKSTLILGSMLSLSLSLAATAKETHPSKKEMPMMTHEQRLKMANAHQQMADCLKSDKPLSECHEQMKKTCSEATDKGACMGMGMMGAHHHMGHDENNSNKEAEDKK